MARCGIAKYDELPALVHNIDVDALRYELSLHLKPPWWFRFTLLKIMFQSYLTRNMIIDQLDFAADWHSKYEA